MNIIAMLPMLRSGDVPRKPRVSGYIEPVFLKRKIVPEGYFVSAVIQAATFDSAIEKAGLNGILLEYICSCPEDYKTLIQHIANATRLNYRTIEKRTNKAVEIIQSELDK